MMDYAKPVLRSAYVLAGMTLVVCSFTLPRAWASNSSVSAQAPIASTSAEYARLHAEAQQVTITRDTWGIPHVHGKTDADAVFGVMYVECEDDFKRVQSNLLWALGLTAKAKGKQAIWSDLRARLWHYPAAEKRNYEKSPEWLKKLMNAWADGLNWYIATHPKLHPVIRHYQPWMAMSFTEGSIGGDLVDVSLPQLAKFYGAPRHTVAALARTRPAGDIRATGSNGIAIAPKLSADGHPLLLINPHVTFNFRTEQQMSSAQGLDAYGASTWGQFFLYQGFNQHLGWMHTSSGAQRPNVDRFLETIVKKNGKYFYRFGKKLLPVTTRQITIAYRKDGGSMGSRTFTAYFTNNGPVVASRDDKWVSASMMHRPIRALEQDWLRTKATDLASFMKTAKLQANNSNDTVYADDQGNIAMLMPEFIPRRNDKFDYLKPVDGSKPATAWQGPTPLKDMPNSINPPNGWVMNTNDWPYSAAGKYSPKRADFPRYMDSFGENARGKHATRMLTGATDFTIAKLITVDFDSWLPAFSRLIPILVKNYDALPRSNPLKTELAGPIGVLRHWDCHWGLTSIPTTLAVLWGSRMWHAVEPKAKAMGLDAHTTDLREIDYIAEYATPKQRLAALAQVIARLKQDFGYWGVPWGSFNRYQRLDDSLHPHFDDAKPSIGVPFTSSIWGTLAASNAHRWPGTNKYYGNSGNSWVAVIDFGPRVKARAIHVGGQSGNPDSPHFKDQQHRWATGNLRTVYFWPKEIKAHAVRSYHPGH
ncbi:MAG: penicillin acylase family protein [Gammaproteobacteria bacterium]